MPAKAAKKPVAKKPVAKKPAKKAVGRAAPKPAPRGQSSSAKPGSAAKPRRKAPLVTARPRAAAKASAKPQERPVAKLRRQAAEKAAMALKALPRKAILRPKPKPRRPVVINIGDEVTAPVATRLVPYRPVTPIGPATARDHVTGLVSSIRDIRTGKTVKTATGDMNNFVFEVLDDRTFERGMSSPNNSESRAARAQVQALLKKMSQQKEMPTLAEAAANEKGFAGLDGWRIVKVRSAEIEPVTPGAGAAPGK
jgi:hypothetical protein